MQNSSEKSKDCSDILDTDFSDWEDFTENEQISDVENIFKSKTLIENLQSTNNNIQNAVSPIYREEFLLHRNVEALNCKEIKLSKLGALSNDTHDCKIQNKQKQTDILNQGKRISSNRKNTESSDSEDFCSPVTKRRKIETPPVNDCIETNDSILVMTVQGESKSQSDSMTISSQETSGSQMAVVSTQESCGSKMTTSSQEICASQNMVKSSQENSASPVISSQDLYTSPKRIASSQESLGNQVMNISIEEDSRIITPRANSNCPPIMTREKVKKSSIMNQCFYSKKLKVLNQQNLGSSIFSCRKLNSPGKAKFTENVQCSVSDSFCKKICRKYNKEERKVIWNIRKRELEVKKREDVVEAREKLLEAREAEILKRETILKAKEQKYLKRKINLKKRIQKQTVIKKPTFKI